MNTQIPQWTTQRASGRETSLFVNIHSRWQTTSGLTPALIGLLAISILAFAPHQTTSAAEPRLNQLQMIGTHNSYHLEPPAAVSQLIELVYPAGKTELSYRHRPLTEQFERLGIRQIELDVFADPDGGLYAWPLGARLQGLTREKFDPQSIMAQPGFKVFHVQDVDYRSTVLTLKQALKAVDGWSRAHPRHVPIMVLLELKDRQIPGLTKPRTFDRSMLELLEREILEVLPRQRLLTPDDVRGDSATLRSAVHGRGWPHLSQVSGRILLALDNGGRLRDRYLQLHPGLKQGLLFASVESNHEAAAWMKVNDPVGSFKRIQSLVRQGFLVRTRADAGTRQARTQDTHRRQQAFASGAQYISTDYPEPDSRLSDYRVQFPKHVVARANPVSGSNWGPGDLERIRSSVKPDRKRHRDRNP